MPKFDVAFLATIEADSYQDALNHADQLAEGIGNSYELSFSAVFDYERDNSGQRVLYLHDEDATPEQRGHTEAAHHSRMLGND